jgi:catechol 2,3-dioxygenase-like lactoylglutathione lyase family enzyme
MRRFHVHVTVEDLAANVGFYSKLFGQEPAKLERDYAKWMLEDPLLNFAISARGRSPGVNHFGIQAESAEELESLKRLADTAGEGAVLDQGAAACCYANSEKHWVVDPQGLAWEHFRTISDAPTFGEDAAPHDTACCIPLHGSATAAPCCVPQPTAQDRAQCC